MPGRETFDCQSNNQLVSVVCSFDKGPEKNCSFPLIVRIHEFGTEEHTLVVFATDEFGQSQNQTFNFKIVQSE